MAQGVEEPRKGAGASGRGPGEAADGKRRRGGCLIPIVLGVALFFVLRDFTDLPFAVGLALLAAVLGYWGGYLVFASLPDAFFNPWLAGTLVLGVLLLCGALLALAPAAPGDVLARSTLGWNLLESRIARLEAAIEADDVALAAKLAGRGLGDPAARDRFGNPVLHRASGADMVAALLDAGLDPDAADERGHTLLMRTDDIDVVRVLLAGGADPNARSRQGFTALMQQGDQPAELIELLLEGGANVHAENDSGRTVADLMRGPGRALLQRYAGGRLLRETGDVTPRGSDAWHVAGSGAPGPGGAAVMLDGEELRPGDVGALTIVVDNTGGADRVVSIEAVLDNGVLFVDASHGGAVQKLGRPGPTSTVRWPLLSLPADTRGALSLRVLARPDYAVSDLATGGWGVDVRVVDLPERTEQTFSIHEERAGPDSRADLADPFTFVMAFLPTIVVALVVIFLIRRRSGETHMERASRFGRTFALACALLCLIVAAGLLVSIAEPYVRFEAAPCEILDQRVVATLVESGPTSGSFRGSYSESRRPTMQGHPLAAVAIERDAGRLITAGWAAGGPTRSPQELRGFPIGSTATCWIDAEEPRRFVIVRAPSAAAIFGILMLLGVALLLYLGGTRLTRRKGGHATAP